MKPLFFGDSKRPLFGIYHPSNAKIFRDEGVLICYPIMHEYMRSHWALRQLAVSLANAGFHVFRFDYFGTGDSAGNGDEIDIDQWKNNIRTAAHELKDTADVTKLSIIGLRLGATLAAKTILHDIKINKIVLWDPIIDGSSYLAELKAMHKEIYKNFDGFDQANYNNNSQELLGYKIPQKFRDDLGKLNLIKPAFNDAKKIIVLSTKTSNDHSDINRQCAENSILFDYCPVDNAHLWGDAKRFYERVFVGNIPAKITEIMCQE
jgi:uncharacterized protein